MKYVLTLILLVPLSLCFSQKSEYRAEFDEATRIFKERNYKEAEQRFSRLLEKSSTLDSVLLVECQFGLAKSYVHQGQSVKSMPLYYEIKRNVLNMKNDSLLALANFSLSSMLEFRSQFDSVEILQHQTLKLSGLSKKTLSDVNTLLGRVKTHKHDNDSALYYLRKAISIDLELQDSSSLPYNYLDLGQQFRLANYPDSAVFYSLEGIKYLRRGIDDFKYPSFYERISQVLLQAGNISKAEEYTQAGIKKAQELGLKVAEERGFVMMAELNRFKNEFKTALPFYMLADSLNGISNKKEREAIINRGIIECELALGIKPNELRLFKLDEFKEYSQSETEKIDCELVLLKAEMNSLSHTQFYKRHDELTKSELISNDLFYKRKLQQLTYKFEVDNALWENAIATNQQLRLTADSLNKRRTSHIVHDLEAQYQKREQDKQIEFLDNENELNEALIKEKNTTIISIAIGLLIACILGLNLFRLVRKVRHQKEIIGISLKEKDTLLREIHHRVKNNLQVISSLLRLQSNSTTDEAAIEALKEGQSRVQSMSLIHQNLYGKDNLTGIGMKNYLEQLSRNLVATYSTKENVNLTTNISELKLDVDTVVPIGLIINELVTNSLKYAFPSQKNGKIDITLKERNSQLLLMVEDNGVGFDSKNIEDSESFGFGLIQAFTGKLDAEMTVKSDNGTRVEFIINDYELI